MLCTDDEVHERYRPTRATCHTSRSLLLLVVRESERLARGTMEEEITKMKQSTARSQSLSLLSSIL